MALRWPPRDLLKQGAGYGLVGALALLVDWGTFVLATWLGMATVPANLLARLTGACIAYVMNGALTFRDADGVKLGWGRFGRYAITWCVMTLLSSVAIQAITSNVSLEAAWLAKPLVEGVLSVLSFLVYRYWIFR